MTENLVFEAIRIADTDFHVRKSIEQCPPGLMERELLVNGFEAEHRDNEPGGRRYIEIMSRVIYGVEKLVFRNTGRGMTADELVAATDLASSIRKKKGLEGRQNRGEGAKVASLPWNGEGMIFRSCHDGAVGEVILKRIGDSYVREKREVEDEKGASGFEPVWDVTNEAVDEGVAVDSDWTEVTLVGNTPNQYTARHPYGPEIGSGDKRAVLTAIVDRFYNFPANAKVVASDEFHGRKSMMELRPMARAFERHELEQSEPGERICRETVRLGEDVEIEYVHLPLLSGANNAIGRYELAGDATRVALVWRSEMYDSAIGSAWRHKAASMGLPYVHRFISVFIHLPDDYPVREDAYRLRLSRTDNGEEVEVDDFQAEVRAMMPEWVRQMVESAMAPRHATDMKAVQEELQKRLREARIKRLDGAKGGFTVTTAGGTGTGTRPGTGTADFVMVTDEDAPAPTPMPGDAAKKAPEKKKAKARRSVSAAPEIIWLDDPALISAEELNERAGKFVRSTNTLYLNALHSSVANKVKALEDYYAPQVDIEMVGKEIIDQVRVDMALHIGTAVVCALAKEGLRTWTTEDVNVATSKEALTISADNSEMLKSSIRGSLSQRASFKAAKVVWSGAPAAGTNRSS